MKRASIVFEMAKLESPSSLKLKWYFLSAAILQIVWGLVTKLISGSAAERAGLREGQNILSKKEEWFKPWNKIEIEVEVPGSTKLIEFFPQAKSQIAYPHYKLKSGSGSTRVNCAAGI